VSACLARRGSRPAGLDNSAAHLATARQLQDRFGLRFPLIPLIVRCARPADLRRQAGTAFPPCGGKAAARREGGRQSGDQRTAALLPAASRAVEPARWRAVMQYPTTIAPNGTVTGMTELGRAWDPDPVERLTRVDERRR